MSYSIIQHLSYTVWANGRLVEVLNPLDEALIYAEVKSSFPSIAKTIIHMWGAETIWLSRLQGSSLTKSPSEGYSGKKVDLFAEFLQSGKNVLEYVESRGPDFLTARIKYRSLKGDPFEDVVEDMLFHLVNHGTYHRGQIITMLRQLGVNQLLSTDLIHFLRTLKK